MRLTTVTTPDGTLSVMTLGPEATPEATTPLLMLHGLVRGNIATWYSGFALPLATQRPVVLYDLRGHGDSSRPATGYTLDDHADDLTAVIAATVPADRPIDLVGHSLGALIALHWTLRHPARVRRLVLVDAPLPAGEWVSPSLLAAQGDASSLRSGTGRRAQRQHALLQALLHETTLVADVSAMMDVPEAALRMCPVPVTLIYGDASPCRVAGERLADWLPNVHSHWLPGGHYLLEEQPAALQQLLQEALAA